MRTSWRIQASLLALLALTFAPLPSFAQQDGASELRYDDRFFTVGDHFYAPGEITVELGTPVRFHVFNGSLDHLHNFMVLNADRTLVGGRTEVIHPNQRLAFEWTPTEKGTYVIACAVCPAEEGMLAIVHVV